LLNDYLVELGSFYGEFDAHNGLWDMVCKTRHDVLHRMALVPRVMEARGLDVTPGLMNKFSQIGDQTAVDILQIIYQEEIGHVAIGNRWYQFCCDQEELNAQTTFQQLINEYFGGKLRGPFNRSARLAAGFETDELDELERCL
ncbi:MAG: ferritin-like domain-containing protein, partial [Gammaproteobacteria bacterium]|nr:ferritin-like domain-containing protein [Gammaproteobacteria bacterium]